MVAAIKVLCCGSPQSHGDVRGRPVHQSHFSLGQLLASLGHDGRQLSRGLHHSHHVDQLLLVHAGQLVDGDEVVLDGWNAGDVFLAELHGAVVLECELVLVGQLAILLVSVLD